VTRVVERFETRSGGRIYRLPLDLFPGQQGYAHLVLHGEVVALFDVGSGFGESNAQLEEGLERVRSEFSEDVGWDDLTHILISHGHIDHFGGLHYVRGRSRAPLGIHELDRRVLIQYEGRMAIAAHRLHSFCIEAGIPSEKQEELLALYLLNKQLFQSIPIDFTFEAQGMRIGEIELVHVPGHCPGQVIAVVDDVLLTADHILNHTSPHQSPERLTLSTGLEHYLASLEAIRPLAANARIALGGHGRPIHAIEARIDEIKAVHEERLALVLELSSAPTSVYELTLALFPDTGGYHELLALEEAAAHVEYLHARGLLCLSNTDALDPERDGKLTYVRCDCLNA
jgi:glyoxylase-like metal-dependent hydrolase (beta-lactamase superfamily II)